MSGQIAKPKLKSMDLLFVTARTVQQAFQVPVVSPVVYEWEGHHIAQNLRPGDRAEIEAAQPQTIVQTIEHCLEASGTMSAVYRLPSRRVVSAHEKVLPWEPAMIFGAAPWPGLPHKAYPWMLATRRFDDHGIHLLRFARRFLGTMQRTYRELENHVHADNVRAVRFLEWLGFTVEAPAPWGYKGQMFRRFWWKSCRTVEGAARTADGAEG